VQPSGLADSEGAAVLAGIPDAATNAAAAEPQVADGNAKIVYDPVTDTYERKAYGEPS
jgi:hypothetical protein